MPSHVIGKSRCPGRSPLYAQPLDVSAENDDRKMVYEHRQISNVLQKSAADRVSSHHNISDKSPHSSSTALFFVAQLVQKRTALCPASMRCWYV